MLHGENRPVTSNLAVEVIAGGFNMAVEVVGEILTSEGSVQSHSVGNAVYYVRDGTLRYKMPVPPLSSPARLCPFLSLICRGLSVPNLPYPGPALS